MSSTDHTSMFRRTSDGSGAAVQWVPMNMYETSDALVIVVPMPGVRAGDVSIELEERRLRLHSELRTPAPKDYLLHEWDYGLFERVIELPNGFGGRISATLGHGQLAVRVSKLSGSDESFGTARIGPMRPTEPLSGPMADPLDAGAVEDDAIDVSPTDER